MLKAKVLIKTTKRPGGDADPPARPRTAGGDRGLLRRFRLGRFLFGSGADADADASAARRGTQHIVRTNSVQAPAPDVPRVAAEPIAQTLAFARRQNSAAVRTSHYSVLSRRSSAPDVAEMARRLSRHVEDEDEDEARIGGCARPDASRPVHTAAGLGSQPCVALCNSSGASSSGASRSSGTSSGASKSASNGDAGQSPPYMLGATLVWTEPQPSPPTTRTASTRSQTPPDSPSLPPDVMGDGEGARLAARTPPRPVLPLPPLPMSPLPPTPRRELPPTAARTTTQARRGTDDLCAAQRRRGTPPPPPHDRPRSLSDDAAHSSVSIASAKALLISIASAQGTSRPDLTIDTSVSGCADGSGADEPSVPVSAPVSEAAAAQPLEQHAGTSNSAPASHETGPAEKDGPPGAVAGSRSLRARSRLAGVGLRRASTYMWERSSVLVRALASTDELPGSASGPHTPVSGAEMAAGGLEADSSSTAAAEAAATLSQLLPLPPPLPQHQPQQQQQQQQQRSPGAMRLHAVRELVTTEKNFVDNLFVIKKVWMEPVFSSANSLKPIIPYQTARTVFAGIAALHAHASRFYREMDAVLATCERAQPDDGMRIGALFRASDRHWCDFVDYVRNYGAAVDCLKQLQDYKPFLRYHEECMAQKRTNRQSLSDLLMLPIQRITRYTLLLKTILKHTPAEHRDHIDLCRAVKNVTHFATIVNECRRKQEEIHRVAETLRSVAHCPPFAASESRVLTAEFIVRELISRQPTRLLLLSDMLVVAQAPAATAATAADTEWSYYGSAALDEVEIQNADESTSTLITILSLNRCAAAADAAGDTSRRSLPSATDLAPAEAALSPLSATLQPDSADPSDVDTASRRRKSKPRRGLLHVGSRESIPDHIAALSHSTFPSPVAASGQLDRAHPWLRSAPPGPGADAPSDRDLHPLLLQRPKTASSHPAPPALALHSNSNSSSSSSGTLALAYPADPSPMLRSYPPDVLPAQLTLVMQHTTSSMRKQFVRALKDATLAFAHESAIGDSDTASVHPLGDSSSEVLSLHPL